MKSSESVKHIITYGTHKIEFELIRRRRKTLEISVYPDCSVRVISPIGKHLDFIKEKIKKRASWILKHIYFFSLHAPPQPKREYVSGESHWYMGRQYRLKVQRSKKETVKLKGGYIYIHTPDTKKTSSVRVLLDRWYREHAHKRFEQRMEALWEQFQNGQNSRPSLQVRRMSSRWGSCSKSRSSGNGKIILNSHLIKAPSHCIDYVIVHELCHLRHPNHSKAFYRLLGDVMPDWRKRKKRLADLGV